MVYDYLVVGAGFFGATFAHEATKRNKSCLVIDKRPHIGGNAYCEDVDGIQVHRYGAHIFHTSDETIWTYVNQFASFNHYINSPVAVYGDRLYNLPFNMNTFYALWGVKTPREARSIIDAQINDAGILTPRNLEEQALCLVGRDIYELLIKEYTEKQWGRPCAELPAFIIKRLPLRFTFDNNYFTDKHQGIPVGGYTRLIGKMLEGVDIQTSTDFFKLRQEKPNISKNVVFTGPIDEYYSRCLGLLEYRSLRFETERLACDNYQGNAVVNYTSNAVPYTRIIEHKHFEFGKQPTTVITREYASEWTPGEEPYYPVNDEKNSALYAAYKKLAEEERNVLFGGRLAEYTYYDMDKVIGAALKLVAREFSNS